MWYSCRINFQLGAKDCGKPSAVFQTISTVLKCFTVLCLAGVTTGVSSAQAPPRVFLNQGVVQGVTELAQDNSPYYAFFAVPYALPPVGSLRFENPEPHPGWGDEMPRDSSEPAPLCPQWDLLENKVEGEEDCLYLNIYTSMHPGKAVDTAPLPVMVVLQGYGYSQADLRLRPDYLLKEGIIVVTLNYRLGVLGFLSTGTEDAEGNYGLFDVVEALKWIKINILDFGGDPTRVTVMGQGSGAAMLSLLMVSPQANGYFWAGIAHSGSALVDWGLQERPLEPTMRLSETLQCPDPEYRPDEAVACLRGKSVNQLVDAHHGFMKYAYFPVDFAPVVDGIWNEEDPFLPDDPEDLFEQGKSSHYPLLTGVTIHEGLTMYQMIRLQKINDKVFTNSTVAMRKFLPDLLDSITNEDVDGNDLAEAVIDSYFRDVRFDDSRQVAPALTELLGDALIYGAVDTLVRLHSVHAPTYTFVLETRPYDSEVSPNHHLMQILQARVPEGSFIQTGIGHGDDLPLLFRLDSGSPHTKQSFRPAATAVRKLWCNFVKHRDPTVSTVLASGYPVWHPYSSRNRSVYRITTHLVAGQGLYRTREAGFWRQLKEAAVEEEESAVIYIYDHAGHAAHTQALALVTAIAGLLMFMIFGLIFLLVSRRCLPPAPPAEPAEKKEEEEEDPDATSV